MTPRVRLDRSGVAAGQTTARYALVALQAPPAVRQRSRQPADVAFVLDRSGSMAGQKITLARRAVSDALRLLRADDRFALVVYDDQVDVVFGSTLASREARTAATRLREIDARGSTDLAGGWLRGANEDAVITKRST